MVLDFGTDEGVKDGEDVPAVFEHARENIAQLGFALGFAMPFCKYGGRNFNVLPQFIRGMSAQEQSVEKRRFPLRILQIHSDFGRQVRGHGRHRKNAVYRKSSPRQVELRFPCFRLVNIPARPSATRHRLTPSNRHRMLKPMGKLPKSLARRTVGRFLRFGMLRGLRSVEIDPDDFRQYLADKHNLWIPHFGRMRDVPIEQLDAIAEALIQHAQRIALAQGAGFGLGGMITILPDASLLTIIALRLIQRLCLLYGFEERESERRIQMWLAAAGAAGIDLGKDLAEKQIAERLAPRIAGRLAVRIGEESAEKWVGRLVPLASSAIGGALNYTFIRSWGRRVHRHLREKHLAERAAAAEQAQFAKTISIR